MAIKISKSICGKYVISHEDQLPIYPHVVEEKYNAKYVGEFCYKNGGQGWMNQPMALFYTEKPHPDGSNYMGVMLTETPLTDVSSLVLVDGISATEHEWAGVLNEETNEIIYSAFRHDCQVLGDLMADGGAEYTRSSCHTPVKLKIVKGGIEVIVPEKKLDI